MLVKGATVNFPYKGLTVLGFDIALGAEHVVKQAVRRHDTHMTSM